MKRTAQYAPHSVAREDRADGTIILRSTNELGPAVRRTGDWLHRWAAEAPERTFLAERSGVGWREETYAGSLQKVQALACSLLGRGLGPETPILILSGNGVDHGLLSLAGQYVGIPVVPLAEQYSLIPEAHTRLLEVISLVQPKIVYAKDAEQFQAALALDRLAGIEAVASRPGSSNATPLGDLLIGDSSVDLQQAHDATGPDTLAKILMTSGSTSAPKGVLTTHRMLCVNQVQIADAFPFLRERPPRLVDWLPWNHTFGGSHNFNMMLANGGSLYIDDGKPLPGAFESSLENLTLMNGTLAFNVPIGYAMLLEALDKDHDLKRRFFEDLDLIFYSGASLPQNTWERLETMAMDVKGEVPLMTSAWGLTETAPAALAQQEPTTRAGVVGVPLTGVTVKLIPEDGSRYEIRVKGDNITPGYFKDAERTRDSFDDEGYLITGDAMALVDPADMNAGLRFDGRLAEDFKLQTGTWVRGAEVRNAVLGSLLPLASDLVITGEGRDAIGVFIFPNTEAIAQAGFDADQIANGALTCARLRNEICRRLTAYNSEHTGSSMRVSRAVVLSDPPSLGRGEMTAKGSLNARRILELRKDLLERLYAEGDGAVAKV